MNEAWPSPRSGETRSSAGPPTGDTTVVPKSARPSCDLCRRSKIKCDRADPCSHCAKVGASCQYSPPSKLPRGRNGGRRKRDSLVLSRLSRLESLLQEIGAGSFPSPSTVSTAAICNQTTPNNQDRPSSNAMRTRSGPIDANKGFRPYLGSSVWLNLSDSIQGLRDVFDQPSEDEEGGSEATPESLSSIPSQLAQSCFVTSPPDFLPTIGGIFKQPTNQHLEFWYSSYMRNVDAPIKILHGPSLRRYLIAGADTLDCSPGPQGWEALRMAIFFVATTSISDEECWTNLGEDKTSLLSRLKYTTEIELSRADFVVSEDLSTLQALVLYLFAVRANENSRRIWTLTSLAVRIAQDMGLHRERYGDTSLWLYPQFECEMRRRLWWQICNLDRLGMSDRGSDAIITEDSFNTRLPLNINDEELTPGAEDEIHAQDCFTDTTFSLVIAEAFNTERRLNSAAVNGAFSANDHAVTTWAQRRAWVIECQRHLEDKYLRHCNSEITVQRLTMQVADVMIARQWLWAYRPLQRQLGGPIVPEPYPGTLHFAVEVLEKTAQISLDAAFHPYHWISNIWVQWHALAVMLAELCVQTQGPKVDRAWAVASTAFDETARHVADSAKGRLWRPIKKLMSKAQAIRKQHLEGVAIAQRLVSPVGGQVSQHPLVPTSQHQHQQRGIDRADNAMEWSTEASQERNVEPLGEVGWVPWLDGNLFETDPASKSNQMGWNDWELFVNDFRAPGELWSHHLPN